MDRKGVITVIILILIFDKGSDASLLGRFRTVAGLAPRVKLPVKEEISPSPSPTSILNFDPSHLNPENSTDVGPKVSDGQAAPSPQAKIHVDKDETNQKGDESDSPVDSSRGECAVAPNRCIDNKKMVACLKHHENGPQELFLLVQNDGESTLKVNITVPASVKIPVKELEIPKHRVKKIKFSVSTSETHNIVLNAGNGECVLHMVSPVSEGFFQRIPSYTTLVSPIYGAYLLFIIALIVGGTWACCKLGKRRHGDGGIPYQELEMGLPQTVSAVVVDTEDGWNQDWGDDWDEDKAVKSAGGLQAGNVSSNGHTSRSSSRDGWEVGWDD